MANEDLGTLRYGIEVDTKGVDKGQEAMDDLQKSAEQTGKSVDGAGKAIKQTGKSAETAAKQVDKYGNELTEADKAAGRFVDSSGRMREANGRFVKSAELAERGAKGYSDGVKEVGVSMRDAIGYATAFAASLGAVAAISAESAKEIQNMARLSGTSVEEFQKLAFGANEAGVSAEKLGDIYKDTQDKVGDFLNTGGGELKDYFENIAPKVGQTAEQFRGLSGPEALGLFQQGLEKANLSAAEQIFYLESLANDASLLTPLLADNGRGFSEAGKRADELNVVLSQFKIDELVEVNKAFNELSTTISRGTQSIVADNAEDIIDAIQSVSETIATATEFLNENMDTIGKVSIILGAGAAAWYGYRAAILASTAATKAFGIVLNLTPMGRLVTVVGLAAGALIAFAGDADTASEATKWLTRDVERLTEAQKENAAVSIKTRLAEINAEIELLEKRNKLFEGQVEAKAPVVYEGRAPVGGSSTAKKEVEDTTARMKELKAESEKLNLVLDKIFSKPESGSDGGTGGSLSDAKDNAEDFNKELDKILDKYNPLLAKQQDLLEEQILLNLALESAADDEVPKIVKALGIVQAKLKEVRKEIAGVIVPKVDSKGGSGMSIFDVGADTSDDFSDVLVNDLSPKLNRALGLQAKTFGSRLSDEFGKLDWGSYGQNIGDALGQALVSGDSSGLRSALGGMLSSAVSSSVGPALTGSLTYALGAGAAGFLGPIGGGIAGAVAEGLLSGKKEVSRSVRIVFEDGIAQAFQLIEYDSFLGGSSTSIKGFDFLENERINNTLRNATSGIDELLEDLGRSVEDFSGTFEGADLGAAIESFTGDYVDAGFGSIEAFQELGESAEQALSRVTSSINDLNDAIRGVVGGGTELAVKEFTKNLGSQIDANTQLSREYWEAAKVAIADLAEGVLEPVDAAEGDLIRGTEMYKRAFSVYMDTVAGGGRFFAGGTTKTGQELIDYINENQLPEAISRLGEGLTVATAKFSDELRDLIDGGDLVGGLETLSDVIATDTENYEQKISNLQEDLSGLGFSVDTFADDYLAALERPVTPEILSRYINGAQIIESLSDATDELNGILEDYSNNLTELARSYMTDGQAAVDYTNELANAFGAYNVEVPTTRAEMLRLAQSIDTTTESGREAFDALTNVADAFDSLQSSLDAARSNLDSLSNQNDLTNIASLTATLTDAFNEYGYSLPRTNDAFVSLIESIDQTTESGLAAYIELSALAPTFTELQNATSALDADTRSLIDSLDLASGKYKESDIVLARAAQALETLGLSAKSYQEAVNELESLDNTGLQNFARQLNLSFADMSGYIYDIISAVDDLGDGVGTSTQGAGGRRVSFEGDFFTALGLDMEGLRLGIAQQSLETLRFNEQRLSEWIDSAYNAIDIERQTSKVANSLDTAQRHFTSFADDFIENLSNLSGVAADSGAIATPAINQVIDDYGALIEALEYASLDAVGETVLSTYRDSLSFLLETNAKDIQDELVSSGLFDGFGDTLTAQIAGIIGQVSEDDVVSFDNAMVQLLGEFTSGALSSEQLAESLNILEQSFAGADSALDEIKDNASEAFSVLSRSINAQKDVLQEAYQSQSDAIRESLETASESISELESVAKSLKDAIDDTVELSVSQQMNQLAAARNQIAMLADSGIIPDSDTLDRLLGTVTADNAKYYETAADYYRDQGRTANDIAFLSELADDQLTEAERSIKLQEQQLEALEKQYNTDVLALDAQLNAYRDQLDALNGINVSVLSVADAVAQMDSSLATLASAQTKEAADGVNTGVGGSGTQGGVAPGIDDSVDSSENSYSSFSDDVLNAAKIYRDFENTNYVSEGLSSALKTLQNSGIDTIDELNDAYAELPAFASGGTHTGGLALVGEYGPEIANMPAGTHISNANTTRSMMSNDNVVKAIVGLEDRVRTMALDTKALYNVVNDTFEGGIVQTYQVGAL
ncbi:MAG: hypothetical protein ACPHUL_00795 [Marinomonas gallaica]